MSLTTEQFTCCSPPIDASSSYAINDLSLSQVCNEKRSGQRRHASRRPLRVFRRRLHSRQGSYYSCHPERQGHSIDWCKNADSGLPQPDVVFYMRSSESLVARPGYGDERYEKVDFQKKVDAVFQKLSDKTWQVGAAFFSILRSTSMPIHLLLQSLCKYGR